MQIVAQTKQLLLHKQKLALVTRIKGQKAPLSGYAMFAYDSATLPVLLSPVLF
jgi:hypothetical protein